MRPMSEICLYTDGGSRNNPGPGAIGIVILDPLGNELQTHAEIIGDCTNNRAEYKALIKGLQLAAGHTRSKVNCFLDSELVVKQMTGIYRLKDPTLRDLFQEVKDAERAFREIIYQHVPRTNQYIQKADKLLNDAFDGKYRPAPVVLH
jgi:ribonuclease HI